MNKKPKNRTPKKTRSFFALFVALVLVAASVFSAWSLAKVSGMRGATYEDMTVVSGMLPGSKMSAYSFSDGLRLDASSTEMDLGVSVMYANGKLVEGIPFEFTVVNKEDAKKTFNVVDDDMDGQIYIEKIDEGEYTVTIKERSDVRVPSPIDVKVEPKVSYEQVDVSDQVKSYDEIDAPKEDSQYGGGTNTNGGSSPTPPSSDTVEYVESSQSTTTNQVEKPVLDSNGNQVYKYKPTLSSNGYLVDAAGAESDIIPVLDSSGYIVSAKRRDAATGQDVDCTAEVLDANGVPLMTGNNYKYKFTKVALTEIVTETVTVYKGWQTIDGNTYYFDKNGNYVTGWQTIRGIQYYFKDNGVRGGSIGIDISTWQDSINWAKVKAAGVEYAFIRLGFRGYGSGALVLDNMYYNHMNGAIAAGIKVGVYFFTQAISEKEAVEEASMCLQYVAGYKISYPIAIDIEDAGSSSARTNSMTNEQRTKVCVAFCETIKNAGYIPSVYANKYYFESKLNTSQLNQYVIWLAHYTSASSSSYSGRYDIWQHTSVGKVDGVSGNVDMNISYLGY